MSSLELYRPEIKNLYLDTITHERTKDYYNRVLAKCTSIEAEKGKDLYDFNIDEIAEVLRRGFESKTPQAYEVNGRIISSYIHWAVSEGLKKGSNPLSEKKHIWFKQFVDDEVNLYLTDEEMQETIDYCKNEQDAIIFQLVFEGICGQKVVELCNLRKDDIDFDERLVKVANRTIRVEEKTIKFIQEALKAKTYYKCNGDIIQSKYNNIREFNELVKNDYVIRPSVISKNDHNSPVDKFVIYRRVSAIAKKIGGEKSLTIKNISRSGMIYYAYKIMKEKNVTTLTRHDYLEIADRFGMKSWFPVKRICNEKVVYKLYGDRLDSKKEVTV